ncbi:MAG: hypothetical protein AAFX92_07575, partial [Pseudomonadota bacterium]
MLTVYYGTNRAPNRVRKPTDFLGRLNPESPRELRFGKALVENDGRDDTESPMTIEVAPEFLNPNRPGGRVLGSETLFREIRHRLADKSENLDGVLLYIHGFGASRGEGEYVFDRVAEKYRANTYYMRLPGHGTNKEDHAQ